MKNKSKLKLDIWWCYLKSAPTFFSPVVVLSLQAIDLYIPFSSCQFGSYPQSPLLLIPYIFFFFFKETIQEKRYRVFFFSSRHLWLSNFMPCRAGNCKCRDSFPAEERIRGRERERERAKEKVWLRGKLFWCWVFVFCASVNIRWLGVTITNVEVLKKIDSLTFSREK